MVTAIGDDAHLEIRAGAVVAATGSYERVPLVPGADRPGVMAARTVDRAWCERFGVLPGERALLVGDGAELATAGECAGARRCDRRSDRSRPRRSSRSAADRARDRGRRPDRRGAARRIAVDLVVFGDRSPNLDLVLAAGAAVDRRRRSSRLDASVGRPPSLFAVGSAPAGRSWTRAAPIRAGDRRSAAARPAAGRRSSAGAATRQRHPVAAIAAIARRARCDRLLLRGRPRLGDPGRAGRAATPTPSWSSAGPAP